MKKIYFAGSIRAGRDDQPIYEELIKHLQTSGIEVLCEHVGSKDLTIQGNREPERHIHDRDLAWLQTADAMVAEVTTPSLGVGYEIAKATEWGKPVLALYRDTEGKRLSAMIEGSPGVQTVHYQDTAAAKQTIDNFLKRSPEAA